MIDFAKLKPSDCLQAGVDGLLEHNADPRFKVLMSTFGTVQQGICLGCMATCTLSKLYGKKYPDIIIEKEYKPGTNAKTSYLLSDLGYLRLSQLELAMDVVRRGGVSTLIKFFQENYGLIVDVPICKWDERFELETYNWEEQIPEVEQVIQEMKEAGL